MTKRLASLLLSLFLLSGFTVFATDNVAGGAEKVYTIDTLDIQASVTEGGDIDVVATYEGYFNTLTKGLEVRIPTAVALVVETSGGTATQHYGARVSGADVSEGNFSAYADGDYYVIETGDDDVEIEGAYNYVISYTYEMDADNVEGADELYFTLLPETDATVGELTFSLTMPKEFSGDGVVVFSGEAGTTDNTIMDYSVDGLTVSGVNNVRFEKGNTAAIFISLPDEYFGGVLPTVEIDLPPHLLTSAAAFAVVAILSLMLLRLLIKPSKPIGANQPLPKDMTPLLYGYVTEQPVSDRNFMALLLMFAQNGWLQIGLSENTLHLRRLTDPPAQLADRERYFYERLFADGAEVKIPCDDAEFKEILSESKRVADWDVLTSGVLVSKGFNAIKYAGMLLSSFFAALCAATASVTSEQVLFGEFLLAAQMFGACAVALLVLHLSTVITKSKTILTVIGAVGALGAAGYLIYTLIFRSASVQSFTATLLCFVVGVAISVMHRRSRYAEMCDPILRNFAEFIENTDVDIIKKLCADNKDYLQNILPYAYLTDNHVRWTNSAECDKLAYLFGGDLDEMFDVFDRITDE